MLVHTAGYEMILVAKPPNVGYVIHRNPTMSLPYFLPKGLWVIYFRVILKKTSKSAVWYAPLPSFVMASSS